jgi:hypothetical protein
VIPRLDVRFPLEGTPLALFVTDSDRDTVRMLIDLLGRDLRSEVEEALGELIERTIWEFGGSP